MVVEKLSICCRSRSPAMDAELDLYRQRLYEF